MRIGELANRLGVRGDTVRFYERAGWLPSAPRQDNGYRDYREEDVEHLRLLVDLRRMDLPLDTAARLASWCHSGHCEETTAELPRQLAEKRREIADRIDNLRSLDGRLAQLERHLVASASASAGSGRRQLQVLSLGGPCCAAAEAVATGEPETCAVCAAT
ncbi:MAG TPA: MerR family transcriptional regulator [Candidatus Limnocylindrales bacterium]|jgi:DNA-binding transcriptional MerR regulator|nr:MerR family transcriptional regulator [Candidatus Limnocylindrales bacterium]